MIRIIIAVFAFASLLGVAHAQPAKSEKTPVAESAGRKAPPALTAVPFTSVHLEGPFWAPRLEALRKGTLTRNFEQCGATGRISNFEKAAKREGVFEGLLFNDSDVYKALEGAAYLYAQFKDPESDRAMDELISKIAAAQQADGYINTYYTLKAGLDKRWTREQHDHESYCIGHLIEAGVAHFQATGKRSLLDVAIKAADHVETVFGPGKLMDPPGHEEIELALVKLANVTKNDRYARLAQFFVELRGHTSVNADGKPRELFGDYCQDIVPVREQTEIQGHAVRAMYLYCGMADLARRDASVNYASTLDRIYDDLTQRKMYITGGIGPSAANEGFTVAYDLPNLSAYSETCASIGLALWSARMGLLHADGRHFDVFERVLYNAMLAGVSLDGRDFFYVNPLASRGGHKRVPWFSCACCPPNVLRFLGSISGSAYAVSGNQVYGNLYAQGDATIAVGDRELNIRQVTNYPWDGDITFTISCSKPQHQTTLNLRVPEWAHAPLLAMDGRDINEPKITNGYLNVKLTGKSHVVKLNFPMAIRRIQAHPNVGANAGRVALQRGPIVYCLESIDHPLPSSKGGKGDATKPASVLNIVLPADSSIDSEWKPDLLHGVRVLKSKALRVMPQDWGDGALYLPASPPTLVDLVAVPYSCWGNRGDGEMQVWIPESATVLGFGPARGISPSASRHSSHDHPSALCDRQEPKSSDDHSIPRVTFWDHRGTSEWVQYDFDAPRRVSRVEVYWFDDEPQRGGCRTPASWSLKYKDGDAWKDVPLGKTYIQSPFFTAKDQFNTVDFEPVITGSLRLEVQSKDGYSSGILEWRVK